MTQVETEIILGESALVVQPAHLALGGGNWPIIVAEGVGLGTGFALPIVLGGLAGILIAIVARLTLNGSLPLLSKT